MNAGILKKRELRKKRADRHTGCPRLLRGIRLIERPLLSEKIVGALHLCSRVEENNPEREGTAV